MPSTGAFRRIVGIAAALYLACFAAELVYAIPKMGVARAGAGRAIAGPIASNLLNSLACFVVATLVGWRRPGHRPARLGWLAGAAMGFFFLDEVNFLLLVRGWPAPWFAAPLALINPWQMVALFRFVAEFPKPARRWRSLRAAVTALGAAGWLASLTAVAQLWRIPPFDSWTRGLGVGPGSPNWLASIVVPPAIYVALAFVGVRNYRAVAEPREQRRMQWVLAALLAAATSMIVFHAVNAARPLPPHLTPWINLPGLLVPLAAAYTLLTDQLLGVSVVVRRGVQYLLARRTLEGLIWAPLVFFALRAWRHPHLTIAQLADPAWLYLGCAAAGAVGLATRRRLLTALDRRFFREAWDGERILAGLLDTIRTGIAFPATVDAARDRIQAALHPEWVEILWRETRDEPVPEPSQNAPALAVTTGDGAVAIRLGPRKADLPYSAADRRLLDAVAAHLALAHENHLLAGERADAVLAERNRLARELHDTLAQGFAGISLHLDAARLKLAAQPEDAGAHLAEARDLARASLAEARRSVHDLRTGGDLPARLRRLVHEYDSLLEVRLECRGQAPLPEPVCRNLYRIAQESLTNVLKHSGATLAVVTLDLAPGSAALAVADNGAGFDPSTPAAAGYGLTGMRERAREIGAALEVESSPGAGSRIRVVVQHAL